MNEIGFGDKYDNASYGKEQNILLSSLAKTATVMTVAQKGYCHILPKQDVTY